nr:immunoglobulin heavy chain junction region [Mus musculus]
CARKGDYEYDAWFAYW